MDVVGGGEKIVPVNRGSENLITENSKIKRIVGNDEELWIQYWKSHNEIAGNNKAEDVESCQALRKMDNSCSGNVDDDKG